VPAGENVMLKHNLLALAETSRVILIAAKDLAEILRCARNDVPHCQGFSGKA
jgi:hypothetical protein